jgi:hypothetical protein
MSEYKWCHGPNCHERRTTNRVRGVKGNKVLRTVKIKPNGWTRDTQWEYFCDQTCLHDFIRKHWQEFVRLHPRTECLETPIEVQKVKHEGYDSRWGRTPDWTETKITVDNERNVG